jgi:hypothetical protein
MPIVMTQQMPGITRELVEEVTAEMHFDKDGTPHGLIVHTATEMEGGVRIVDVWESAQDYEEFTHKQLIPALEKVAAAHNLDMSQMPGQDPHITEAFDTVKP